jgi:hypothetical protein
MSCLKFDVSRDLRFTVIVTKLSYFNKYKVNMKKVVIASWISIISLKRNTLIKN